MLLYVAIAVATTWPLAPSLTRHLVGGTADTLVHYWNGWWVRQAIASDQTPFRTSLLFYPEGVSLAYHNFAWINIAMWLLAEPVIGGYAAYNVAVIINLAVCGYAAFLLARELTGDARASLLAGVIYQCWPYRMQQLDHPNLVSTGWIPLYLLCLIRAVRCGRWISAVLAGAFLAIAGYARWQLLVPAVIVGGIYVACALIDSRVSRRRLALMVAVMVGTAAIALLPPTLILGPEWRTDPAGLLVQDEESKMQTDLLAYITPSSTHPVLGSATGPAYERYYFDRSSGRRFPAYLGASVIVLAALGIVKGGRDSIPWALALASFILLALGPVLRMNGNLYPGVPMPYTLAARLFFVRLLRFPDRYNMFLALPSALLAAYGSAIALGRVNHVNERAGLVAAILLGGLILFEYLAVPVSFQLPRLSALNTRLIDDAGEFALLNLPIDSQQAKLYMFAQTTHGRPILQGKTARLPADAYDFIDGHAWLRDLRMTSEMLPKHTDVGRQLNALAACGVRYIVVHKGLLEPGKLERWRRQLLIAPRFEDEGLAAYATAPEAGTDFTVVQELASGVGPIRVFTSTACLNPGGVLEVDIGWGATAAPGKDLDIRLSLRTVGGYVGQLESYPVSSVWPVREWPAGTVAWGYYTMHTRESLPPGSYAVLVRLIDHATGTPSGDEAIVGVVDVRSEWCEFDAPAESVMVNSLFGSELRLLGYAMRRHDASIDFTLYWRSEHRMSTAYKTFVHVFDPESERVVAQYDGMPRQWTYLTSLWGAGEQVADAFSVSLDGVPQGTYHVAVGVYDPATMERLTVTNDVGQPQQAADQLVLASEEIEIGE